MKNTVIITAEMTSVAEESLELRNACEIANDLKEVLGVDDVVITKVQVFEGTDSAKE